MGSIKGGERPLVENPQMQKENVMAYTDLHTSQMRRNLPDLAT